MTASPARDRSGLLDQPRAVWAVAFACVVAFMGIGLVDPILTSIAADLDAGPSDVSLLFTSYFAVTGVSMLLTGFVSSRIGARKTLLTGLALVVVFSALAGSSSSIAEIVGFRAGWGLGNALFIATALSVIIGSASGGVAGAVILYEAALGIGIASGPLLGGLLGDVSWRGPFFGTAVLMAVGFVAITALLERTPASPRRIGLTEPLRALTHPGLAVTAAVAVLYNFGFFTLLAYTPFPLDLGAHALGLIFFGWGLCLAITSVFLAPVLQRRFGDVPSLLGVLALFAADLLALGLGVDHKIVLVVAVVVAGGMLGVVNTVLTETVMKVSDVERPIASAAYSFVRFTGGAVAPYLAGRLAEGVSPGAPFFVGAVAVAGAVVVLVAGRRVMVPHETGAGHPGAAAARPAIAPVLAAIDATSVAERVTAAAARVATARRAPVELVHVLETDVTGDGRAADLESAEAAQRNLDLAVRRLTDAGIEATGEVLRSVGDHRDAAQVVLDRAAGAGLLVVGAPTRRAASLVRAAEDSAGCDVLIVRGEAPAPA